MGQHLTRACIPEPALTGAGAGARKARGLHSGGCLTFLGRHMRIVTSPFDLL